MKGLSVDGILAPRGALQAVMPRYEARDAQLRMARAVERAISSKSHLMAEAGTGTGKTLAYLVPAALAGKRVIVSTATRTLQDQIFQKDIPLLRDTVGLNFTAALLKGRSNYLCGARFEQFDQNPLFATPEDASAWPRFRKWALSTDSGDRSDAEVGDTWSGWPSVTTTADACLGTRCPHFEGCFVTRARKTASESQVVVVNHALFFADLALRARGAELGLQILPDADVVIFDEAHALEDVATDYFGLSVGPGRITGIVNDTVTAQPTGGSSATLTALAVGLKARSERLFGNAQRRWGLQEHEERRLTAAQIEELRPDGAVLLESLGALAAACPEDDEVLGSVHRRCAEAAEALQFILEFNDSGSVYWVSTRQRSMTLRAAPIEVGKSLATHLYGHVDTVVFTSATLTTSTNGRADFGYASRRFGIAASHCEQLRVESPFDYEKQAALYVSPRLPEPNDPRWTEAFTAEVLRLLTLTNGRAFVLFTSLRHMHQVHERVAPQLQVQVLKQGDLGRNELLARFVAEPSVLFASQSFWEGVDVPGDALSLVIIDKLPFAPPNDPLQAARMEAVSARGGNAFNEYQVPQAALSLRQGFGRLIRTATDRGIVALGDTRLITKRYGQTFLESLPKARRFTEFAQVEAWWRST